jgi:hypothetical protein
MAASTKAAYGVRPGCGVFDGYFADRRSDTSASSRQRRSPEMTIWPPSWPIGSPRQSVTIAAGAFDQGDGRLDVPGLQAGLDDHVHLAHGDHGVGVGVAAQAGQLGGGAHLQPGAALGPVETGVGIGGGDDRVGQQGAFAHLDRALWPREIRREPAAEPMKISPV